MLDKNLVVKHYYDFIETVGLEPNQAIVNAGGAICLLGGREYTSDIDLGLASDDFDRIAQDHRLEVIDHPIYGTLAAYNEYVDLHRDVDTSVGELLYGVWINTLEDLLKFKLNLNRDKDQADIDFLRKFILSVNLQRRVRFDRMYNARVRRR